jgi:hypothetical protein
VEASYEHRTPSDIDAMGQDKRRKVIGHTHGPSRRSQLAFFGAVALAVLLVVGGYFAAVAAFDQPKDSYADRAPWASPDASHNAPGNSPLNPSSPCGEPGNPPGAPGSACAAVREAAGRADPP